MEEKKNTEKEKKVKKNPSEVLQKEIETLKAQLEESKAKLDESKNDYIRLMAEFETFRRRTAEDKLNLVNVAAADTIKGLLPVLDDCERGMALLNVSADDAESTGTGLIYSKLMGYLKGKGLERLEAKGEKFDTDLHEAVAQVPVADEAQKGLVFDVVKTGYKLNGKLIRFAQVVVGI